MGRTPGMLCMPTVREMIEARERDGLKLNAFEVSALLTSPAAERKASESADGTTAANERGASGTVQLAGN